jgi:SAM-dependent methyltransferase
MSDQVNDYLQVNRRLWNERVQGHLSSDFYDVEAFVKGKNSLNSIELDLLGDVRGKRILHLQCHFGQDTLSLARMGAIVTGVDFSDASIAEAMKLAAKMELAAEFVCCDVYSLPDRLAKQFDIVFTSYGTIGWLPDVHRWAEVVSRFLAPGGKFVFADFHPVVWMFDDDFRELRYSYFNTGPIVETAAGSYAGTPGAAMESIGWNHPTAEVITALLANGLSIQSFSEFDYSPYNCFRNMTEEEPGRFRITGLQKTIPLVFSLVALKAGNG